MTKWTEREDQVIRAGAAAGHSGTEVARKLQHRRRGQVLSRAKRIGVRFFSKRARAR